MRIEGRARRFGDDVDTDTILASRRKKETLDPGILRRHLFESADPGFAASVEPGDLIVAGRNFGCGSAMEVAVTVVLGAGIRAVLAGSFARTYFRNAVNNGLVPVECDTSGIREGDRLVVEGREGVVVRNETQGTTLPGRPLPSSLRRILQEGGLVSYLRRHGSFTSGIRDSLG